MTWQSAGAESLTRFRTSTAAPRRCRLTHRSTGRAGSWLLLGERRCGAPVTLLVRPPANMDLRSYRNEDWVAVRDIYDLSKPDEMHGVVGPSAIPPLESDQMQMALFRESQIVVAEEGLRVIGFAGIRGTFITWLFVHPAFRRKGVATALIREILGCLGGTVMLNVVMTNSAALALYHRNGFTIEREFAGQFQGTPCIVAKLRHEAAA